MRAGRKAFRYWAGRKDPQEFCTPLFLTLGGGQLKASYPKFNFARYGYFDRASVEVFCRPPYRTEFVPLTAVISRRKSMALSKRAMLAAGSGFVVALSTAALAQAPKGNKKSSELTHVDEGEAIMIGPQGRRLHKSHAKVSAAQHQAAMRKGAVEVKHGSVLYKQGGKFYMLQDSGNEKASQNFQD